MALCLVCLVSFKFPVISPPLVPVGVSDLMTLHTLASLHQRSLLLSRIGQRVETSPCCERAPLTKLLILPVSTIGLSPLPTGSRGSCVQGWCRLVVFWTVISTKFSDYPLLSLRTLRFQRRDIKRCNPIVSVWIGSFW